MKNSSEFSKDCVDCLKAVLIGLVVSLALVLIFALIVRWASLDEKIIVPVNYAIKILSLALGCLFGFTNKRNGVIKGAVSGLVFMLLTFFVFAALDGFKNVHFNWIDLICLTVAGGVCGVISVNLHPTLLHRK